MRPQSFIGQQLAELVGWDRSTVEITLGLIAIDVSQKISMLLGFDTLGDHPQRQAPGHVDDRSNNR